ncbi:hypothetical protein CHLRE_06g281766v5 [Chlamydomonas reinhardtii]|uniref:Uncharacterized protein n=1 Tax=Chlamydomonas reinhardtii TaxID=3055 RepID=A0A2K3DPQ9_CHLRE|nr:uncharacterized protein CHLRE_06g281766v5 [Chlamydomonas reinhardtii]PNW82510.1 hypothetical protein CHLRE_06g281766v5 [Chlamydomonas reinhardtii]
MPHHERCHFRDRETLSLTFHPDKCSLPQSAEVFLALKHALNAVEQRQPSRPEPTSEDPWAQFFAGAQAAAPAPQPPQPAAAPPVARPTAISRAGLWAGARGAAAASTWGRSAFASAATATATAPAAGGGTAGGRLQNARRAADLQKVTGRSDDVGTKPSGPGARSKAGGATVDAVPAVGVEARGWLSKRARASASPAPRPQRPGKLAKIGGSADGVLENAQDADVEGHAGGSPFEQDSAPSRAAKAAGAVGGSTWTRRPVFAPHVWLGAGEARGSGGARAGGAGETAIDSKKGRGQQVRRRRARRADVSGGPDVTWASGSGGHQQAQGCIPGGGGSSDDEGSSGEYLSSNNSDVEDDSDFELVSEDGGGKDEGPQCAPGGARQKQAQPQRSVAEAEAEEAVAPDGRTDCRQGWGRGSSGAWQQRRSIGAFGLSAVAEPPAASAAVPSTGCSGAASSSGAARPASGAVAVAPAAGPSATTASCATGVLVLGESRPRYTSTTQKQLQEQPCQHAPNRSQDEPSSLGRTSRKGAAGPHREPLSPGTAVQAASASLLPSGRSLAATSVTAAARDTVPASAGVATTRAAVSTAAPWAEPSRPEQRHIHGSGGPAHAPLLPPAPAMGSRAAPAAAAPAAHAARAFTSGCSQGQGRPAYEPAEQCPVGAHDAGALREAAAPPTHPSGPGGEEQSAGWDHVAPGSRQWEEGVDNGLEEAGWQDDGGDDAEGEAGGDGGHDLDEELWGDGYGGGEADPEDHLDEHWGGFGHQEHHPNEQSKTAVAVAAGGGGGGGGKAAGASKRKAKQSCLPFQQQKQPAARQRLRQHQQVEGGGAAGEEQEAWAGADGGGLPEGALDTFLQQVQKDADQQAQRAGQARLTNLRSGFLSFGGGARGRGGTRGRGRGRGHGGGKAGGGSGSGAQSSREPRGSGGGRGGSNAGSGGRGKGGGKSAVGILRFSRALVPV